MGRRPRKIVELVDPQVAHALNDDERAAKAIELAQMCGEIDKLRADAADAAGTERKKIRALEKRRRLLAECVRTGNEMRSAQEELFREKKPAPRAPGTVDSLEEIQPAPAPSSIAAQAAAINAGDAPVSDFLGPDEDWASAGERSRDEKPRTVEDRMIHAIDARAADTAPETPVAKAKNGNGRAAAKHH